MRVNRTMTGLLLMAAAVTVGLSGCTGTPGPVASVAHPSAAGSAGAVPGASATPSANALPGHGVYSGLKLEGCGTATGDVTANGTMTMPEGKNGTVTVTVSWVDSKTNAVRAAGKTQLEGLKAGQKKDWSISAKLPDHDGTVICVPGAAVD